ncbi:MAG: hypothetical protein R3E21_00680 [Caenibius sp.]|nr:hypothetical protein [Novosphingobium sp.]
MQASALIEDISVDMATALPTDAMLRAQRLQSYLQVTEDASSLLRATLTIDARSDGDAQSAD